MKNLANMISYALIVILGVFVSMSLCACSEDYSDTDRIVPAPKPDPKPDPTPDPTPSDSTDNSWRWSAIMDQTVNFDTTTEIVTANNIAQLSKQSGETKLDSAQLKYQFGVAVEAPTRIVTTSKDTTVYTGKGLQKSEYSDFVRTGNDSLRTVTTTVEGGFKTSYYTLSLTTSRKEGFSLHAGKWLSYKNVTESSQLTSIWHEELKEVEVNDSIFNRETVHNVITITLRSDKGKTWTIKREKVVIVDHFLKIREEEKKEEKVTADEWIKGLGRLVSLTKCLREDTRFWCDAALIEGADGYTIVLDTYDTDGKYIGREVKFVSFEVCPRSNDYDGVAWINGGFYPGKITYDSSSRGWVVVCYINGNVLDQSVDARDADARGIKNFKDNNTAYPWPYMTNTSTSKEVNGKQVITIMGKTSTRAYRGCVVADSSLKK
jgi:hypothetical protein